MEYEIVGVKGAPKFTKENVVSGVEALGFTFSRFNENNRQRAELQGAPVFKELCSPMFGGEGKVRYETKEAYELLSN